MDIPCVGAIVVDDAGRILLIRRANPPAQGMWSIPGGRVEPGESHEVAVVRELHEETGLVGVVAAEVGTVHRDAPTGGRYVIRDFALTVADPHPLRAGDDASEAAWFTVEQLLLAETSPGLVDALVAWDVIHP